MTDSLNEKPQDLLFGIVVYLAISVFTWSGVFASVQADPTMASFYRCRTNMSMSLLVSLIPVTWILAPFTSGFYQDGFKLSCGDKK